MWTVLNYNGVLTASYTYLALLNTTPTLANRFYTRQPLTQFRNSYHLVEWLWRLVVNRVLLLL